MAIGELSRVAVLITCHNRKNLTLNCLESLRTQIKGDIKFLLSVYLVDDGSTDGTAVAVKEKYPEVTLISGHGALYWNRGMHLAFEEALGNKHDFYLWLNDDTHLFQSSIDRLLNGYLLIKEGAGDKIIVSGPAQAPDSGEFTYGGVVRYRKWYGWRFRRIQPSLEHPTRVDATNGNCVLIPANVAELIGNLDPVFKHKWGDHDYCFRASKKGCSVWLLSEYVGTCKWNSEIGTWKDKTLTIRQRYKQLWAPSGLMPNDYWVYLKRHRGWSWPIYWVAPFLQILHGSILKRFTG